MQKTTQPKQQYEEATEMAFRMEVERIYPAACPRRLPCLVYAFEDMHQARAFRNFLFERMESCLIHVEYNMVYFRHLTKVEVNENAAKWN